MARRIHENRESGASSLASLVSLNDFPCYETVQSDVKNEAIAVLTSCHGILPPPSEASSVL